MESGSQDRQSTVSGSDKITVDAERVYVRPLQAADIGMHYVSWFDDAKVKRFIYYAKELPSIDDLKAYWRKMDADPGVEFLGLFLQADDRHIGNIKYETGPLDDEMHVGFLIGDAECRGKGVLSEILHACNDRVIEKHNLRRLYLTVNPGNRAGIKAFTKLGFVPTGIIDEQGDLEMNYVE